MPKLLTPKDSEFIPELPSDYCARFARLLAEKMFGLNYQTGHAWIISKRNNLVAQFNEDSKDFQSKLYPGAIVTWFDRKSKYNSPERIKTGTHAMLYLGNQNSEPIFAEQRGQKQQIITLDEVLKQGLKPRQIVLP